MPATSAFHLLGDTAAVLACLRVNMARPVGNRFLPPTTLRALDRCLSVPDPAALAGHAERRTHRARFIHFTCEAASLVAPAGGLLAPTAQAAGWLGMARWEQLRRLFEAASEDSHELGLLWRAYRLPAWRAAPRLLPLPALLASLGAAGDRGLARRALLRAMPVYRLDDEQAESARRDDLTALLDYLGWFGALEVVRPGNQAAPRLRLSGLGRALLANPPLAEDPAWPDPVPAALTLEPGLELRAPPSADPAILCELADYAVPVSARPVRRYCIDPIRLRQAAADPFTRRRARGFFLRALAVDALPAELESCLEPGAADTPGLALREVALLEAAQPEALQRLLRDWRLRAAVDRLVAPNAAIIRPGRAPDLARRLARRGLLPAELAPSLTVAVPGGTAKRGDFSHTTLAHLALALRLCQVLADLIPARYRPPHAVQLDVDRRLSPRDRALVDSLAREFEAARAAGILADAGLPEALARRLAAIGDAIDAAVPVSIDYLPVSAGEAIRRVIDPLTVEWRGRIPYLIAYCRASRANRTFRIDRILRLHPIT